jgi:hypothetical protein
MTTILILNAAASALAAFGLGGVAIRARRRAQRVRPVILTVDGRRRQQPE